VQHFKITKTDSVGTAGYIFAYVGVIMVLIQGGAIRPLSKRFGETPLVLAGIFLMAVGFLVFGLANSIWILMLGPMLPICVGMGLNSPSLRALISKRSHADHQGGAMGLSASFDSLARFIGPALAGELYNLLGPASPYWSAGVFMSIAFLFALSQRKKLPAPTDSTPEEISHSQPEISNEVAESVV
jgi:MFS family permease